MADRVSDQARYDNWAKQNGPTDEEQKLIAETFREFGELQLYRNAFASQWEEIAELVWPTSRNTFYYGNFNWQGMKKTDRQVDATGMMALQRFGAICDSLITPKGAQYQKLVADSPYVMKDRATKLYFERLSNLLFRERYKHTANFTSQNQNHFISLGAFGTGTMFVEQLYSLTGETGLRYIDVPLGEMFMHENQQHQIDGFVRWHRMTARQAYKKWGDAIPPVLKAALDTKSEWPYNFLHRVVPRDDYDPQRPDAQGKPWASYHISVEGMCLVAPEGGYRTLPIIPSRYMQAPGECYGRSPAMMVLPALKTLNAEKRTYLKVGHRAADPVLLVADDGLMNMNLIPGAVNPGGLTADGKPLVVPLPVGQVQVTLEMMQEERALINDAFLVTLFQILTETPQMSATEVIERVNEKAILLAPTVGRQDDEYLEPLTARELDCLAHLGKLPPMPPRLREARGEYQIVSCGPISKMRRAGKAAGFMRTVQSVENLVQITGDTSLLHPFNFKKAIPEIAAIQDVPESWMSSDAEINQKDQQLAQSQQRQQQIQAAPAQAAMMKAQAVQAKAGMQAPQQQPQQASNGQGIQPNQGL